MLIDTSDIFIFNPKEIMSQEWAQANDVTC